MKTTKMSTIPQLRSGWRACRAILVVALCLMISSAKVSEAGEMGTAFTYQGRLIDANSPADGLYDFQFKLYDDANTVTGNQVGSDVNEPDLDVIDGYFTVELDFGSDVFDGNAVWLEIDVRPGDSNDPNAFITLSPRQEVTPTPYALQTRGIFVDKAKNVGIGTKNPEGKLHVDGGKAKKALNGRDGKSIVIKAQDGADALFGGIGGIGGNIILQPGEGGQSDGVRMRSGRVGIGTDKPEATLDVRGNVKITGGSPDAGKVLASDATGLATWQSLSVLSDGDWTISGSDMYSIPTGNVGIGEASPLTTLHVGGNSRSLPVVALWGDEIIAEDWTATLGLYSDESASHGSCITLGEFVDDALKNKWGIYRMTGPSSALRFSFGTERNFTNNPTRLTITAGGSVGIGTTSPGLYKLNVQGGTSGVYVSGSTRAGHFEDADGTSLVELAYGYYGIWADGQRHYFKGRVGIGNSIPQAELDVSGKIMAQELEVDGRTTTDELQIMGGADLAEPFEISDAEEIPAGAVVVIDEETPGQLKLSRQAYDKRVAGVVSGAGGIKSGLVLSQKGILDQGLNVALSGRVYVLANCCNDPIRPGDMLTTSDTPGYAMKATDPERSYGAVIGKAMSNLQSGEGLILVLVTLQ